MSSTIGSISGSFSGVNTASFNGRRSDLSKMAVEVFEKLDTGNKGYIDKTDLQNAVDQIADVQKSSSGNKGPSADDLLKAFDGNGDGKISKQEFTVGTKKLAEQFESQFNQSRTRFDLASTSAVDSAFSQLDTGGKGYLDKTDLENAAKQAPQSGGVSGNANGAPSTDEILAALDTDSDGKITKVEFSSNVEKVARPSGPPPNAPVGAPAASGVQATGSTISSSTYESADTNQDGTVTEAERLAYQTTSAYVNAHPEPKTSEAAGSDEAAKITQQVLQFLQNYAQNSDLFSANKNSSINVSA